MGQALVVESCIPLSNKTERIIANPMEIDLVSKFLSTAME
jgi:hypothetical protein